MAQDQAGDQGRLGKVREGGRLAPATRTRPAGQGVLDFGLLFRPLHEEGEPQSQHAYGEQGAEGIDGFAHDLCSDTNPVTTQESDVTAKPSTPWRVPFRCKRASAHFQSSPLSPCLRALRNTLGRARAAWSTGV